MDENITIEFVRNWIEKHHLTRKSYESVLTDALTNNGHYYIDNPYLRDWIRENTETFRNILPYELNENQQIVLNQAKINAGTEGSLIKAIHSIYSLNFAPEKATDNEWAENWIAARKAMRQLSRKEEAEVFAVLAEWGMKNEQ